MRTFVISDAHGYPEIIQGALDHGHFRPGVDAFVYAGDLLDRGPDSAGCLELVERYAIEVLVGNHELAVLLGFPISGSDRQSREFRQLLLDRVLSADPEKAWKAATCVGGSSSPMPASCPVTRRCWTTNAREIRRCSRRT